MTEVVSVEWPRVDVIRYDPKALRALMVVPDREIGESYGDYATRIISQRKGTTGDVRCESAM